MVTVLFVILAACAVITAVLSFVLLSPLSVRIRYSQKLEVFAGISFIKFKVFPKRNKKKLKKDKIKKQGAKDEAPTRVEKETNKPSHISDASDDKGKKNKKNVSETLKLVFEIIKSVFGVMGKRAVIKIDELKVVVSKPDAADTAVQFGICGGVVSNILAFTTNFGKAVINDKNVSVEPDFISGKSRISADITLSVPAGSLLMGLVRGYLKGVSKK